MLPYIFHTYTFIIPRIAEYYITAAHHNIEQNSPFIITEGTIGIIALYKRIWVINVNKLFCTVKQNASDVLITIEIFIGLLYMTHEGTILMPRLFHI